MTDSTVIRLKKGRDRTGRFRHPWIFSGAIAAIDGNPQPGDIVRVVDSGGDFIGQGYYNPLSQIAVRILEFAEAAKIDGGWWDARIAESIARRRSIINSETNSCRLIYGEADFLPGLIVDLYADFLTVQFLTAGTERLKNEIVDSLTKQMKTEGIYERGDSPARKKEGLPQISKPLYGRLPPSGLTIRENGLSYEVDIIGGQKTGWYFDQRDNRLAVAEFSAGGTVLDCFSYSGGFSIAALTRGAAHSTLVDSSAAFLDQARRNLRLNHLPESKADFVNGDAFDYLRELQRDNRSFDLVILDPPKFAPTKNSLEKAMSGYKDINLLGLKLVRSGGYLATFSCSGAIDWQLFRTAVGWAAIDSGRKVQITHQMRQAPDHPVLFSFPQSEYLKGFLCRVE